jgi:hypothetical protein
MISSVGYAEFCLDLHCRQCVRLCIGVISDLMEHVVVFWLVMMKLAAETDKNIFRIYLSSHLHVMDFYFSYMRTSLKN